MSNTIPTPAQINQFQQNLQNMQLFNDYVWNLGQSKVFNAYLLLSEQDASDPGLTVGLNILGAAFSAIGSEFGIVGGFVAPFLTGIIASWATSTPPSLNTTFANLLSRLDEMTLQVDQQLAQYHQDVINNQVNWQAQFTNPTTHVTISLSDLATITFPAETDTQFEALATAAVFALDQNIWKLVLQENYVITLFESSSGPQIIPGSENDPPTSWEESLISGLPAYYATWTWSQGSGCGSITGWEINLYNIGTGAGFWSDGSMSVAACAYLFIDSADGVIINPSGLYNRATVFNALGISNARYIVPTGGGGIHAKDLTISYLRAMKNGKTLGALVNKEGREVIQNRIIEKAQEDLVFKTKLALRPRQTLEDFLEIKIPEVISLSVIIETPRTFAFVVPMKQK